MSQVVVNEAQAMVLRPLILRIVSRMQAGKQHSAPDTTITLQKVTRPSCRSHVEQRLSASSREHNTVTPFLAVGMPEWRWSEFALSCVTS